MEAHNYGVSNLYELAEYVQLSEEYIVEILKHYKNKYGIGTNYGEYLITFDPLRVLNIKKYKKEKCRMKEPPHNRLTFKESMTEGKYLTTITKEDKIRYKNYLLKKKKSIK